MKIELILLITAQWQKSLIMGLKPTKRGMAFFSVSESRRQWIGASINIHCRWLQQRMMKFKRNRRCALHSNRASISHDSAMAQAIEEWD
jgi:hypothetical protein